MCGIQGLLTAPLSDPRDRDAALRPREFFEELDRLLGLSLDLLLEPSTLDSLRSLQARGASWVDRDGFLALTADASLRTRLTRATEAIQARVVELESRVQEGRWEKQTSVERINELILLSTDLAWTLRCDALENVQRVERLLGAHGNSSDSSRAHGWALNLILNGIDRLEVRGRDSAGLAVYVRFPSSAELDGLLDAPRFSQLAAGRLARPCLTDGALVRPRSTRETLLFSFKVAEEVGKMGDNVQALRQSIAEDALLQEALRTPGAEIQALAHTRWASNGIVSLPNCHPVDSAILRDGPAGAVLEDAGEIIAVLNGDIDNYQELCRKYVDGSSARLESGITTDAKIIPVVIAAHYREHGDLEKAFRQAFDEFEGSMAIGVLAADHPGGILFGQKGSGQGLYLGYASGSTVVASEMYGLVEVTSRYVKAEGERRAEGEIFRITGEDDGTKVWTLGGGQPEEVPQDRLQEAEITTRDINRGDYPHFLLKEISESITTVRKTLRGKFELPPDQEPRFHLGAEVLDPLRLEQFRQGKIRRIIVIGQGTAAIAGDGIARLIVGALEGAPHAIEVTSTKATELSAHGLRPDMKDTLVLAVSQSGTTTDTNRTVDMARERGAWILGIVNRRNSDLVYKSHGVLYTSDGRDIEMSVASTKAFYAQNVVGQVLALALGQAVGSLDAAALREQLTALEGLPQAMEVALQKSDEVCRLASVHAPRKRYWAMVGSGATKVAADEIRIKLSELCYKSIASDFTEDKKHIDLSSEPLILVCAAGVKRQLVSDLVKEVAIFKAHQSVPLVIVDEGEKRFDPYATGVIAVPRLKGRLGYLLSTLVGHLFGYHAARAFDAHADDLRRLRAGLSRALERETEDSFTLDSLDLEDDWLDQARALRECLLDGSLDSCLDPASASQLVLLLQAALSRNPGDLPPSLVQGSTPEALVEALLDVISQAIHELARPIDAIKHQAKTVTVGISRGEDSGEGGLLRQAIRECGLEDFQIPESTRAFLGAFEPVVASVEGSTLYRVSGLDAVGRPREDSRIQTIARSGSARELVSRCDQESPLAGTKWGVVKRGEVYLGRGQTDGRKILILPATGEQSEGHLLLLHLEIQSAAPVESKLAALRLLGDRLEELKIAITEQQQSWNPALLGSIDAETLYFSPPEEVARQASLVEAG